VTSIVAGALGQGSDVACNAGLDLEESVAQELASAIGKLKKDGVLTKDFMWGTATAAYQVEGGWNEGGRVPSHWDTFTHTSEAEGRGKIKNNDNGDVACDFYHKYADDIKLMKSLNFTHFRYSIAWPRVMNGSEKNEEGIKFYRDLTKALVDAGIEPVVTLYHWDLPSTLDWRNETVVDAFGKYADLMFWELKDVKYWLTFNEIWVFCKLGYHWGTHAPGVVSDTGHLMCGHNVLKSHAKAYSIWKEFYADQRPDAKIGITLNSEWRAPLDASNPGDVALVETEMDSQLGWFAEPIFGNGDYPESLKAQYGDDMPVFTTEEKAAVKGSADFFGLNHYTSLYVDSTKEYGLHETSFRNGVSIGPKAASKWLYVVPWGFSRLLRYIKARWNPSEIIVTENGTSDEESEDTDILINDQSRIGYYQDYLSEMAKAMMDGVPVIGYFAWSLLDNFEWADGYDKRFGLTYIDFKDPERPRTVKKSAEYLGSLIPTVKAMMGTCKASSTTAGFSYAMTNETTKTEAAK